MGLLLAKFCVLTACLQLVYQYTYRRSTSFHFNRWHLLSGMYLAFVLPWIPLEFETTSTSLASPVVSILQPEDIGVSIASPSPEQSTPWLTIVYATGLFLLLIIRMVAIGKIWLTIRKGHKTVYPEYILIETSVPAPCSFYRYIFLPEGIDGQGREAILYHERTHITQGHYLDLWVCELFCLLQWFNPFAWKYKHALMENHEFLADEAASQAIGEANYQQVLIDYWLRTKQTNFIHPFAYSSKLTRLSMLKKGREHFSLKKSIAVSCLLLLTYGWLFAKPILVSQPLSSNTGIQIKGKITDTQGQSFLGAHAIINSKQTGTISDFDGNFCLSNAELTDTLSIGFPGYDSQLFPLSQFSVKNGIIELSVQLHPQKN